MIRPYVIDKHAANHKLSYKIVVKDGVTNGVILELLTGFENDRVGDKLFTRPFSHIQSKNKLC